MRNRRILEQRFCDLHKHKGFRLNCIAKGLIFLTLVVVVYGTVS